MTAIDRKDAATPAAAPQGIPAGAGPRGPRADRADRSGRSYGVAPMRGVMLVACREILTEVRQKSFLWGLAIMVALVVAMIIGSSLLGSTGRAIFGDGSAKTVAVTSAAAQAMDVPLADAAAESELEIAETQVASAADGAELLRTGGADELVLTVAEAQGIQLYDGAGQPAALASAPGHSDLVVVGASGVPSDLVDALTVSPQAFQIGPGGADDGMRYAFTLLFAIAFMMGTLGYCQRIAQVVVEEKASRIVEILLATVTPKVIMAGKVIGNSILALGQMAILALAAAAAMAATGQLPMLAMILPAMLVFSAFYVIGFVMLAALYAGAGALVSRQEEVASATMPLMMLIMLPYMGTMFLNGNPGAMTAMSYIPFSSPIAMPVRMIMGEALWWEPLVALAILVAATVAAIWVGARIYENSILRMGGKVKLADAMKAS